MNQDGQSKVYGTSRQDEEMFLAQTLAVIRGNLETYGAQVKRMREDIDDMLDHFHDDNPELINLLEINMTLHGLKKRALEQNERALDKPYFGRIDFFDEALGTDETIYIGKGGISKDTAHQAVVDWRAPVANAYYENGLGKCSYPAPGGSKIHIDLKLKRTYEIEKGKLLDYYDSEVVANDELLTKYLAKNKQAVLGEIIATIQKEQNDIIRKSPYHNIIVQGVAGSGKTTVAMHRISFILYNYQERFKPDDFYIVGSNRILLNYITGVLPDLDVYGIRQMTMEQLFTRLLYEDWDEKKYGIKKSSLAGNPGSIKGTNAWFGELKKYCDDLEWNSIPREHVYLNPQQFVEGLRDGKSGVYDTTIGKKVEPYGQVLLMDGKAVERYILQNPKVSMQGKINMLNERLAIRIKEEFLAKSLRYTDAERKAILKAYRGKYGGKVWKGSIYGLYRDFLEKQAKRHSMVIDMPSREFDVYDLAALAYIYKRIKETEVISEAHHIVIDEAQDYGMMAYSVLDFCIEACTYTVMGDVSQNIHFGFGLNDWEELKTLLLKDKMDSFGILKKSYRNTVEISEFATGILHHGQFSNYPVEPIIRHGSPVKVEQCEGGPSGGGNLPCPPSLEKGNLGSGILRRAADICGGWQKRGFDTIAVVCRNRRSASLAAEALGQYMEILENDLETAEFGKGVMVLPVEYTKGLEFDAVLILAPTREEYPVDDGHAKLLYVAATRALHELCILHSGNLTGLIADPVPEKKAAPGGKGRNAVVPEKAPGREGGGKIAISPNRAGQSTGAQGQPGGKASNLSGQCKSARSRGNDQPSRPKAVPPGSQKPLAAPAALQKGQKVSFLASLYSAKPAPPTPALKNPLPPPKAALPGFGDIPPTEKLRPIGHSKIDLSVRWVAKAPDGLCLQSRYGTLKLSPIGSAIIRVTFAKNDQPDTAAHPGIAVDRAEKYWMYKDSGSLVELKTDELALQVDKAAGAIRFLSAGEGPGAQKLLLPERKKECRQLEKLPKGGFRAWLFLDFSKEEHLYAFGPEAGAGIPLKGTARYISCGDGTTLPLILSDKGYGIVPAASSPMFCCNIPAYGSYLHIADEKQLDYYFIAGKKKDTILDAYAYLCGRR